MMTYSFSFEPTKSRHIFSKSISWKTNWWRYRKTFKIGFQRYILFYFQRSNQSHQIHICKIMSEPPRNVTYIVHINSATSRSTTEVTLQSCSAASCLLSKPSTSLITIFLTIAITYMCNNWLLHASELWQLYSPYVSHSLQTWYIGT